MAADRVGFSTRTKSARARLKQALCEDWAAKRFAVKYQPQVNLRSRKISRFEALLRWERPGKAAVSPKEFIPLAEEIGLIEEIGQWVLEVACADAMLWPAEIGVAVNVSAIALRNSGLPSMVRRVLQHSRLDASRLELEITETAEIGLESIGVLYAIQKMGVRITIDDLDVGHSSLRYLLDFPFDKVKVDGLYAVALGQSDARGEAALAIMRSIAEMCRDLRIDSLAEAIETREQLSSIMDCNFTEVQGFIFGQPVYAGQVPESILYAEQTWKELAIPQRACAIQHGVSGFSFFQVADAVNDIVIVTSAELTLPGPVITYVNPAFTRLTGFTAEEAIGKTPRILQGPGTDRRTLDVMRTALAQGNSAHGKILNYAKNGAPYWLDLRIEPMRDGLGKITHFVAIERDVTLDKRRLDELEHAADRDILTGIPNRRAFLRAIEAEIEHCQAAASKLVEHPLCVAWIDVDGFKQINDSFGHAAGDSVLFCIAERLANNMRRVDTIGRLSGDEFALCLPAVTGESAGNLAERLRQAVTSAPFETSSGPVSIAISIGVAELQPAEDAASLMARADAAMYEAKRAGGDRVRQANVFNALQESSD